MPQNVTVSEGGNVTLSCNVVRGSHQVAWVYVDSLRILTITNFVITTNPRIEVSNDGHSVWNLHIRSREILGSVRGFKLTTLIRDVEQSDEGRYMCQINTARLKSWLWNLHVVCK